MLLRVLARIFLIMLKFSGAPLKLDAVRNLYDYFLFHLIFNLYLFTEHDGILFLFMTPLPVCFVNDRFSMSKSREKHVCAKFAHYILNSCSNKQNI